MDLDPVIALAGLGAGVVVGLTGMGGGALLTPILVIFLKVQPLAAVSSDLVAAVVMKPIGGGVHLRRGTVHLGLVRLLCTGSVPAAFAGVLLLRSLDGGPQLQRRVEVALGAALLLAAAGIVAKSALRGARSGLQLDGPEPVGPDLDELELKAVPTIAIGALGGLVVGMTSVGSGSLMIVALMMLYPTLSASRLVGTDLVQAIPLVMSAAAGHLLFGSVDFGVTASLLLGSVPGVYVGARMSAKAPDRLIRPALVAVLALSALKLLGAADIAILTALGLVPIAALAMVAVRAMAKGSLRRAEPTREPTAR